MRCGGPSPRPAAFPPPSPPPSSIGFVRGFNGTTQPSDSSPVPRQLRLLDFLSRPGIAQATAGQTRSPRFRRDPFVRDVASDPGRATVPRITAPHMLPSAIATASAPAISRISWLNPTPQTITVYASPWSSPSTTQHSLPGGRCPFPGPDFHRLDRASFAWRTAISLRSSRRRLPGKGAGRPFLAVAASLAKGSADRASPGSLVGAPAAGTADSGHRRSCAEEAGRGQSFAPSLRSSFIVL
jgi:hypothetical protein